MHMKAVVAFLAFAILMSGLVLAESTQQYNKIFLNPFYAGSMVNNQNMSFLVNVNPPDGIDSVISAIINFQIFSAGQSITYTLWVDNRSCNTPNYAVSTTYTGTGQYMVNFDCSNMIVKNGIYNVTIRPSGSNNGAVTAWLDLTYMNNPEVRLTVHGTEYQINDNATVFVQVPDFTNTTLCTDKIYYPNASTFRSSGMNFVQSSSGLYYDNFMLSNITGVYMIESACYMPLDNLTVPTFFGEIAGFDSLVNSTTASTVDTVTVPAGTEVCFPNRFFEADNQFPTTGKAVFLKDIINAEGYLFVPTATRAAQLKYNYYSFDDFTNIFTLVAVATGNVTVGTTPTNVVLNNVTGINVTYPTSAEFAVGVCITNFGASQTFNFAYGAAANDSQFTRIYGAINVSNVVTYRGGGEIHVSNLASNIWNYSNRTLTDYNSSQIYQTLLALQANQNTMNSSVTQVLALLQNVNLSVAQILYLTQQLNLTDAQELVLLQQINASSANHTAFLSDINNTVYMNKATLATILALAVTINATTLQNLGLLVDVNGTVYTNTATLGTVLAYVNDTNATVYMNKQNILDVLSKTTEINITTLQNQGYLQDINGTVYVNKAGILLILSNLADVNQTVYMNKATLTNILGYVQEINSTTLQSLGLLQDVNGTVYMNKATLNTLLGLSQDANNTAYLDYLLNQQINGTVNYNRAKLDQLNLTADQIYSLLQTVNTNVFLNGLGINSANQKLDSLTNITLQINLTTGQTYLLLQNLTSNISVFIGNLTSVCNSTQIALDVASTQVFAYPTQNGNVPATGAVVNNLLGGVAYAQPFSGVTAVCLSNTTLMETTSRVICAGSTCQTYATNQTTVCQFGCNSENVPSFCNPSPSQTNWYFFLIIAAILIISIIAVAKLR